MVWCGSAFCRCGTDSVSTPPQKPGSIFLRPPSRRRSTSAAFFGRRAGVRAFGALKTGTVPMRWSCLHECSDLLDLCVGAAFMSVPTFLIYALELPSSLFRPSLRNPMHVGVSLRGPISRSGRRRHCPPLSAPKYFKVDRVILCHPPGGAGGRAAQPPNPGTGARPRTRAPGTRSRLRGSAFPLE